MIYLTLPGGSCSTPPTNRYCKGAHLGHMICMICIIYSHSS